MSSDSNIFAIYIYIYIFLGMRASGFDLYFLVKQKDLNTSHVCLSQEQLSPPNVPSNISSASSTIEGRFYLPNIFYIAIPGIL